MNSRHGNGGLTIHVQSEAPGGDDDANWLPSPADGEFFVILRLYLPRAEVIDASWECPPLEAR